MRIAIVTDIWEPQVNSLVNTVKATVQCLRSSGHEVKIVEPAGLPMFSLHSFPEIRLAGKPYRRVERELDAFAPDAIHILTEGTMGLAARRYCLARGLDFTSSCNAGLPGVLHARTRIPVAAGFLWLSWFHRHSRSVMVFSQSDMHALRKRGVHNVVLWGRGIDTARFQPERTDYACIQRPLHLFVGRLSADHGVVDFLRLDVPGSKWVIGDGPLREELEQRYPQVKFLGQKENRDLPPYYNCADVLVYPGKADTLFLSLLEAMACGIPVATYAAEGANEVVANGVSGALDKDLASAVRAALALDRGKVRQHALAFSSDLAASRFLENLCPARLVPIDAAPNSSIV
ncbi:MAG TPA: glycosyltransferase [Noviherbaspirillum sp.]|nr:glycosyltransferase [Noviherbaspirillum sp.]